MWPQPTWNIPRTVRKDFLADVEADVRPAPPSMVDYTWASMPSRWFIATKRQEHVRIGGLCILERVALTRE